MGRTQTAAKNSKLLKIVQLIFSFETGGNENLLVDLVNEQVGSNDILLIIVNKKIDRNLINRVDSRVRVERLNRREGDRFSLVFLLKLWKLLLHFSPDVIHCHHTKLIALLPFFRNKAIVTINDVGNADKYVPKYRKVFALSHAVANDLEISRINSTVVESGIDFASFKVRDDYSLSRSSSFRIVQVSRMVHEKKGHDLLIQALRHLVHQEGITNISVDFVGEGKSNDFLRQLTATSDLNAHVNFLGNKDRSWVQHHLCNYHLLVQPSRYEGFGLTVVEGIAAGLPVVASDIEGPAEILSGVKSGFLFPKNEVAALSGAIKTVISLYHSDEIRALCKSSLENVKQRYSIARTAKEYLAAYNGLS